MHKNRIPLKHIIVNQVGKDVNYRYKDLRTTFHYGTRFKWLSKN